MAHSTIREFDDPLSFKAKIRNTDVDLFPTAKGVFRGSFTLVNFERLWLQGATESLPRVYVGSVNADRATFGFLANFDQSPIQHCGIDVVPGEIIFNNNAMMHRRTVSACKWSAMTLPPSDLASLSEAIVGHEISIPQASQILRPPPETAARLLKLHSTAVELARNNPDALAHEELARALEDDLIVALIKCLDEGKVARVSAGNLSHHRAMKRLEAFLVENAGRPVYLADICKATGASERILRASCQEALGMSPIRYLWLRRMHLARQALIAASHETTTVTTVAMDNGFWELGRFATEYRSLFGESPSITLRRPPESTH